MRLRDLGPSGWDTVTGFALLGLAAVVWWQAELLPPPIFDPIGPAAIPQAVALVIALFSILMIAGALRGRGDEPVPLDSVAPIEGDARKKHRPAWPRATAVVAMLVLYGALLETRGIGFLVATMIFVAGTGIILSRGERRTMVASVVSAVVLSVACSYLFTQIFYIDLP